MYKIIYTLKEREKKKYIYIYKMNNIKNKIVVFLNIEFFPLS